MAKSSLKQGALPKTIGGTADGLYRLREKRLDLERQVKHLQSQESALKEHGIKLLHEQRLTSGRGKLATFSISTAVVPHVVDWEAFYKYVGDTDAFDMLQRRVNNKAWLDRVEIEGVAPPGTQPETITKTSLTKVPGGSL